MAARTLALLVLFPLVPAALAGCGGDEATDEEPLAPALGTGDHTPASVTFTEIAGPGAMLDAPRDLAFNPLRPDELWVVSHASDSTVIVHDATGDAPRPEYRKDGYALHFMAEPTAIAFGASETTIGVPGTFATCGESRNTYDGELQPGNDFMGPTLWSSDPTVYAAQNPNGLGSHLDMLHNSPLCTGIAHEAANVYWAFGGLSNAIYRYDFGIDDGIGNDDHGDGTAYEYVAGEVAYVAGVPSHLALDPETALLYVADTGNSRIAALDTTSGTMGPALSPLEPMEAYNRFEGAVLTDVVPASASRLGAPSGIELEGGLLYVSDHSESRILAFTLEGELVNHLDTGLPRGSLGGLAFGPDGKLYLVDMTGDRVLRIDPATTE